MAQGRAGRHVRLVRTDASHYPELYRLLAEEATSARWRTRGRPVAVEAFETVLLSAVDLSLTVADRAGERLLGLIQLRQACWEDRRAELEVVSFVPHAPALIHEAVLLALDEVFWRLGLRLVHLWVLHPEPDGWLALLRPMLESQGVLRRYRWHAGEFGDVEVLVAEPHALAAHLAAWPLLAALAPDGWRCAEIP